jgi:hypothetical protein
MSWQQLEFEGDVEADVPPAVFDENVWSAAELQEAWLGRVQSWTRSRIACVVRSRDRAEVQIYDDAPLFK